MDRYRYAPTELALLERATVPVAIYQFLDKRVVTLALSAGFCKLFGFEDRAEAYYVMDHDMYRDAHPDDVARIANAAFVFATRGGEYDVVYRTFAWGQYRIIHAHGDHVYTPEGVRIAVVSYSDEGPYEENGGQENGMINQALAQALHENSLYRHMNYDYLTGLPSMTYFFELADAGRKRILEAGQVPALLFLDLSGMKFFNRKYGFAEGDKLIHAVGKLLVKYFSNENCSHFGQDHFAVYTTAEGLEERLKAIFEECKSLNDGKTLPLRAGIFLDRAGNTEVSVGCDRAKMASNVTRKSYLSHYRYFDQEMLAEAEKHQYIIDNLDRAIRDGWIQVWYQPIIRAANGRVSDEEALARWIDPVKGMLAPADFIPILEDAKLIYKLDLYVVDQVLKKMKRQADAGLFVVPQSVNLSRADFDGCDIVAELCRRVDAAGISRGKLTIEITESVIGHDFDFMKAQIERLHKLGFHVWMDDFGSGYSSLDLLLDIHFDLLKFDMRFMQHFSTSDKSRIILTELIKMAISLGIETVVEGVERKEQVEFLRDVGCAKLQGFYYCQAIPLEKIVERNRLGIQIGFENPEESSYYAALGRVSLYDLAVVANEDAASFKHYFDTMPMAILETDDRRMTVTRCNKSYREFMERSFGALQIGKPIEYARLSSGPGSSFMRAVRQCRTETKPVVMDERLPDGSMIHALVRRIAENPVTGVVACVAVVLGILDAPAQEEHITFAHVAQALSADYFDLYYVNLDTEQFTQYNADASLSDLSVESHGSDFFAVSRASALDRLYPEDRQAFIEAFTKENVMHALDVNGVFALTYRLLVDGEPMYMHMKVMRMSPESRFIIIGVTNVDAQKKRQVQRERLREERITYSRVSALTEGYVCIYTVDPQTSHYVEYSANEEYKKLGIPERGDDFFRDSRAQILRAIHPDDQQMLTEALTKDNIITAIREKGIFSVTYRLLIGDEPTYMCLKGALVVEKDGPQLILSLSNVDAQVRRDQEYASNLSAARAVANIDELTGVKNKRAYADAAAELDRRIAAKEPVEFALLVMDVDNLKRINDTHGHQAGDRYLRKACAIICGIFQHSPVFRFGGDEFAVIAQGEDYKRVDALIAQLEENNRQNAAQNDVVVACGMSRFRNDPSVSAVFDRADANMYENKKKMKAK